MYLYTINSINKKTNNFNFNSQQSEVSCQHKIKKKREIASSPQSAKMQIEKSKYILKDRKH